MTGPDLPLDFESPTPETPPSEEPETLLRPELLDGLDLSGCVKLRQHGIDSVENLAVVEPLELARSMEIGITRVMRLRRAEMRRYPWSPARVGPATWASAVPTTWTPAQPPWRCSSTP